MLPIQDEDGSSAAYFILNGRFLRPFFTQKQARNERFWLIRAAIYCAIGSGSDPKMNARLGASFSAFHSQFPLDLYKKTEFYITNCINIIITLSYVIIIIISLLCSYNKMHKMSLLHYHCHVIVMLSLHYYIIIIIIHITKCIQN